MMSFVVVFFPLYIWFTESVLFNNSFSFVDIFPAFGLIAFSVMWLHIIGGSFKTKLSIYFDFEKFVSVSSKIVLISLILHPLLFLIFLWQMENPLGLLDYVGQNNAYLIWLAIIAWLIFISYDIVKKYQKRDFFAKHWQIIRLVSTLAFFLVFFHSLGLGRNLQVGFLRYVWFFYGLTALIATIYTYFIRREDSD